MQHQAAVPPPSPVAVRPPQQGVPTERSPSWAVVVGGRPRCARARPAAVIGPTCQRGARGAAHGAAAHPHGHARRQRVCGAAGTAPERHCRAAAGAGLADAEIAGRHRPHRAVAAPCPAGGHQHGSQQRHPLAPLDIGPADTRWAGVGRGGRCADEPAGAGGRTGGGRAGRRQLRGHLRPAGITGRHCGLHRADAAATGHRPGAARRRHRRLHRHRPAAAAGAAAAHRPQHRPAAGQRLAAAPAGATTDGREGRRAAAGARAERAAHAVSGQGQP